MSDIGTIRGVLTLEDLTSQPADRARDALRRFRKGADDAARGLGSGLDPALGRSARNLEDYGRQVQRTGQQLQSLGTSLSLSTTATILALGGSVIKAGSDFESSFAGVRKTVNATEKEFAALSASLRELAAGPKAVPIDVNELNKVAESAGQLGIAKEDIIAFTRSMAALGTTTNLTADEAAVATAQFQNIFGAAGKEVDRFGSTLVALGNAGASTEKQIIEMGLRIAGAGNQVGMSQGQVLAFASALSSVGIEAEAGGSALSKVINQIALSVSKGGRELENFASVAHMSSAEFSTAFQTDAAGAVESFVSGLGRIKDSGGDVLLVLDQMGITEVRMRDALVRAAGAGDLLRDSLDLQARAWKENNALTNEAAERYKTFESQLQIFWNRVKDVAITLGTSLLPVLNDVLASTKPLLETFARGAEIFASLPSPVKLSALAFAGIAAAIGPVVFVAGQLIQSYGAIIAISPRVAAAVSASLGPWGLLAAAITAATIALSAWISKWKSEMQGEIEQMVADTNKLGESFQRLQGMRAGGVISDSDLQARSDELAQISDQLDSATKKQDAFLRSRNKRSVEELGQAERNLAGDILTTVQNLESRKKLLIDELGAVKTITTETKKQAETTGTFTGIVSESVATTNNELGKLIATLKSSAAQSREMAGAFSGGLSEDHIALIRRAHALHTAYLQDVETFGKKAAEALKALRAADYDALEAADKAQKIWALVEDARNRVLAPIPAAGSSAIDLTKLNQQLQAESEILDQINGNWQNQARSIAAAQSLHKQGLITQEQLNEYMRQYSDMWEQLPAQISISEQLLRGMVDTLLSAADAGITALADGIVEAASGGEDAWKNLGDIIKNILKQLIADWLAQWFRAMAQWLARWTATQAAAKAASASLQGPTQSGGNLSQANSLASLFKGGGAAVGVLGTAAVFAAIYVGVSAWIKSHKEYAADVTFKLHKDADAVVNQVNGYTRQARGLTKSVKEAGEMVKEFLKGLGGALEGFSAEVTIGSKGRGKNTSFFVQLQDGVKEWFTKYEDALEFAIVKAVESSQVRGFSPLMQQGLENADFSNLEDLGRFLSSLQAITQLDWSDSARQVAATTTEIYGLWEALRDVKIVTPEVEGSLASLGSVIVASFDDWYDKLTGRVKSPAELEAALKRDGELYNAQLKLEIARIHMRENDLAMERRAVEARIKIAQGRAGADRAEIEIGVKLLNYRADQIKTEMSLEEQRLAFIDAELKALADILAALPPLLDVNALKLPKNLGSGIGGGGKDAVRDFIKDTKFDIFLRGLSDYKRSLAELNKIYDQQLKQAGNDKKLRAELIALREKELQLLRRDEAANVLASFNEFMGLVTPFDQVRKTAADLIKQIEESPFGDPRKGRMIARVLAELDQQLQEMSDRAAVSLFGELLTDLEKFGADEKLMADIRRNMAVVEHTLKMAHYRTEFETLKALGKLSAEQVSLLERSISFLEGVDPAAIIGGAPPANDNEPVNPNLVWVHGRWESSTTQAGQAAIADIRRQAEEALQRYTDQGLDPTLVKIREITEDFAKIRKALGDTPEVLAAYNAAIKRVQDEAAEQAAEAAARAAAEAQAAKEEAERLAKEALEAQKQLQDNARAVLKRYTDEGVDPLVRRIEAITKDFDEVRKVLGDTPEVLGAFTDAIKRATDETYAALKDYYKTLLGPGASATIEQQFNAAKIALDQTLAAVRAGDTTKIPDILSQGQAFEELLGQMFGTSTGGFISEREKLAAQIRPILEAAGVGVGSGIAGYDMGAAAKVLNFPAIGATADGTSKVVSASDHIADVVQLTGTRQETVLIDIRTVLREMLTEMRAHNADSDLRTIQVG